MVSFGQSICSVIAREFQRPLLSDRSIRESLSILGIRILWLSAAAAAFAITTLLVVVLAQFALSKPDAFAYAFAIFAATLIVQLIATTLGNRREFLESRLHGFAEENRALLQEISRAIESLRNEENVAKSHDTTSETVGFATQSGSTRTWKIVGSAYKVESLESRQMLASVESEVDYVIVPSGSESFVGSGDPFFRELDWYSPGVSDELRTTYHSSGKIIYGSDVALKQSEIPVDRRSNGGPNPLLTSFSLAIGERPCSNELLSILLAQQDLRTNSADLICVDAGTVDQHQATARFNWSQDVNVNVDDLHTIVQDVVLKF